jgi:archaellum component FlaG (FlaF/FlaG flagellin family)
MKKKISLYIKFTGAPVAIAGSQEIKLSVDEGITYRGVIRLLGERYPQLVGILIDRNLDKLLSSNVISVNGEEMIMPGMEDRSPSEGDRLILVSLITGG